MTVEQKHQEVVKELFRLKMFAIVIPRRRRELNEMNDAIMSRLIAGELAKNKLLSQASKKELHEENWLDY
jgi:hypothetical protein